MKERIILARDLLNENGIIFISLDDNMQAYFKVLMDEIFGEENFVSTIIWQNTTGTNDALFLKETTEYVIMYARNKKKFRINKIIKDVKNDQSFKYKDKHVQRRGLYKLNSLDNASHSYSKGLDFPIIIDGKAYYAGKNEEDYKRRHSGIHAQKDWRWMWSKEKVLWGIKNDYIINDKGSIKHKVYQFVDNSDNLVTKTQHFLNLILVNEFSNLMGTIEQKKIFQRKVFDHPKPQNWLSI